MMLLKKTNLLNKLTIENIFHQILNIKQFFIKFNFKHIQKYFYNQRRLFIIVKINLN